MSERHVTIDMIMQAVGAVAGVTRLDLTSDRRPAELAAARFAVYWLATKMTTLSSVEIGRLLGDRDHTSVLHGLARAEELRATDPQFRVTTDTILATLIAAERTGTLRLAAIADPLATARRVLAAPEREAVRVPVIEIVALCRLVAETFGEEPDPSEPASKEIDHAA
jgi:hypothetical protein